MSALALPRVPARPLLYSPLVLPSHHSLTALALQTEIVRIDISFIAEFSGICESPEVKRE